MFLSKNISILRKRKGLSQEKFAEKIGESSRGTVAKWETGETKPSIEQIDIMAQFFDVSLDQLVRYDFSKNETYDALDNSKDIVKLISGMLHGNEDILKFVDVKVLIGVVIDLTLSKAEAEEAIDKRKAVALYMEAGALGEQKAYEKAYHLVEELLNGIGKIKSEEELDRAIELKELSEDLYEKIWGFREELSELMLLSYQAKERVLDEFFVRRQWKEEQRKEAIESARIAYNNLKAEYSRLMLEGKKEEAEKLVFVINKYALAGYADEEVKKYMINVGKK